MGKLVLLESLSVMGRMSRVLMLVRPRLLVLPAFADEMCIVLM